MCWGPETHPYNICPTHNGKANEIANGICPEDGKTYGRRPLKFSVKIIINILIGSKILLVIVNDGDTAISSDFTAITPPFSVYLSSDFLTQVLTGTLNININPTNQFNGNPMKA